jgi:hypothetical protein
MTATLQTDQNEAQVEALRRRLSEVEDERDKLKGERDKALAGQAIAIAAAAAGVLPSAIPDAVNRAQAAGEWKPSKGGRFVLQKDGFPDYNDRFEPISADVFLNSLKRDAPYFWPTAAGEDATAAAGPAAPEKPAATASNKRNPFTKEHWNLTKQCELYNADRALAERLSAEAGVPIAKS